MFYLCTSPDPDYHNENENVEKRSSTFFINTVHNSSQRARQLSGKFARKSLILRNELEISLKLKDSGFRKYPSDVVKKPVFDGKTLKWQIFVSNNLTHVTVFPVRTACSA